MTSTFTIDPPDCPWADATLVGVWPSTAQTDPGRAPQGTPVTTGLVVSQTVTFSGLQERVQYVAYAGGIGRRFVISSVSDAGVSARLSTAETTLAAIGVGTATDRQRPQWDTTTGAFVWRDMEIVDLRDYDAVRTAMWQTTLGGNITSGQPTLTNSAQAFTQADVGATIVIKRDSGTRWITTILSVNGAGVATLSSTAPSTSTNQRIYWGRDGGSAINAAMQDFKGLNANPKRLLLVGWHRASQIVVPPHVWLCGNGWGSYGPQPSSGGPGGNNGTVLQQLVGAEKDFIVFEEDAIDGFGQRFVGPVAVTDLVVAGPEADTGTTPTLGGGVVTKNAAGNVCIVQDGFTLENVHTGYFPEDGFFFASGGLPLAVRKLRAFYNGGYGINFIDGNASTMTQGVHFQDCSGDGNRLGLLRIKDSNDNGSIVITNIKSEKGDIWGPAGTAGPPYQENAIIFDECDNVPVVINGVTHISSKRDGAGAIGSEAPGPAILIRSTTTKRPRIRWNAVTPRLIGGETANVANCVALRDESTTPDIDFAPDQVSGRYPAMGSVVAAATITLAGPMDVYEVTGNTNITAITASYPGRVVTLIFRGTPTLTDGSNLKLPANFVATADDAYTLVCDGTNWYARGPGAAN